MFRLGDQTGLMSSNQDRYPSIRPYLGHAIAATAAVVLLPVVLVMVLVAVWSPTPPLLAIAAVGVLTALGAVVIGTALWMRRPDAAFISFSDLMILRWMQRRRAEKQLAEGARLLGLDPTGQPIDQVHVSPEDQLQVLKDLTAALEAKDPYTHGHSQRVERHAYRTAAAMGLSASDLEDVRKAAALHDVGKIRVSDRILRKDGPLTDDERKMIEEHAVVGAWMVSSVGNADVIAAVRHHHEAWDGSGYPDGVSGTEIPLFARIIAVADAYDAINSTRPYRASCGRQHAVEVLKAESGRQFDPKVVECFLAGLPTRLPVAAGLLVAVAGPQRLLRELFAWFRRFGAGSLSPSIGAAGAAVVLGASVFTPNLPVERPQPRTGELNQASVDEAPVVLGTRVDRAGGARPAKAPERKKASTKAARPAPTAKVQTEDAGDAGDAVTAAPKDDGTAVERDVNGAKPTPPPPPVKEKPEPVEEPQPKPRHTPPSDPQPDKGEDCGDRPAEQAQDSPGRAQHCD